MSITRKLFDDAYGSYRDVSVRHMAKCINVPHATVALNVKGVHSFRAETWLKIMALLGAIKRTEHGIEIQTENPEVLNSIHELSRMPLFERY